MPRTLERPARVRRAVPPPEPTPPAPPAPAGRADADRGPTRPAHWAVPPFEPRGFEATERRATVHDLPAAAALLERLFGPVPVDRVVWDPFPGTATFEDCVRFNETGHLCELVDGVLLEKAVGWIESEIAMRLGERVGRWDPERRRGRRTGADGFTELRPDCIRGPDYSFYLHHRFPGGRLPAGSRKIPELTPDFCVEILSESNTRTEIDGKLDDLFASGCRLAWVIDPRARTARVVTPAGVTPAGDDKIEPDADARPWVDATVGDDATLAGDPVLPGFSVSLADLLAVPAPPADGEPGGTT